MHFLFQNARFQQERTEKLANEHAARLRRNALWEVTMPAASEQKSEKNKAFTAYTVGGKGIRGRKGSGRNGGGFG